MTIETNPCVLAIDSDRTHLLHGVTTIPKGFEMRVLVVLPTFLAAMLVDSGATWGIAGPAFVGLLLASASGVPARFRPLRPLPLLLASALAACGDAQEDASPREQAAVDSVTVVFTRDEEPAPVTRPVARGEADLRAALSWLVRGPTPAERASGIRSWFSEETAHVLRSATVDEHGHAVVDLDDLRPYIGNAGTSTGSTLLLLELNGTVFQFPEIQSVEYRMEGSCELFGEWIQYGCRIFRRQDSGFSG